MSEGYASFGPGALHALRSREPVAWMFAPLAVGLGTLAVAAATIERRSLSIDEAAALAQAHQPFGDVAHAAVHDDPAQGGYLVLLHLTARLGTGEATIRLASAVAIALAAALLVVLGTRLLGRVPGVVAGVALGANAGVLDVAREARPYALGILGVVACTLAFTHACQSGGAWRWACFGVLTALVPLTHPLAAAVLAVYAAVLGVRHWTGNDGAENPVRRIVGAAVLALVVGIVVAWMAADRLDAPTAPGTLDLSTLAQGGLRAFGWSPLLVIAAGAGLYALLVRRTRSRDTWEHVLIAGIGLAPALACLLAATFLPVFAVSSLTLCAPGIALAAAASIDLLPGGKALAAGLTALALAAAATVGVRIADAPAQDWRAVARAVRHVRGPHETVVVLPARAQAVLAYYAPYVPTSGLARGTGAWVAVAAATPAAAIALARPAVHTPTYALLRQSRYGDGLRLQHWVRP